MAHIVFNPISDRAKPVTKVLKLPRPGFGNVFGAILKHYGNALSMTYVEPFRPSRREEDRRI